MYPPVSGFCLFLNLSFLFICIFAFVFESKSSLFPADLGIRPKGFVHARQAVSPPVTSAAPASVLSHPNVAVLVMINLNLHS